MAKPQPVEVSLDYADEIMYLRQIFLAIHAWITSSTPANRTAVLNSIDAYYAKLTAEAKEDGL